MDKSLIKIKDQRYFVYTLIILIKNFYPLEVIESFCFQLSLKISEILKNKCLDMFNKNDPDKVC